MKNDPTVFIQETLFMLTMLSGVFALAYLLHLLFGT
jgi:hypothetical protein